jgi:hypothetical protein
MTNKLVLYFVFALLISGVRVADAVEEVMPVAIDPPYGNVPLLDVFAKGDQIFMCAYDGKTYSWKWQAPDAKLYDTQAKALIGSHGAGPSWTYRDGSGVKGKIIKKVDAPDKSAAQWLLLEVIEHSGKGVLTEVTYIQRTNTQGGVAPASGCDANHLGAEKRVPYSALYGFYKKQ